jgi:hypothetical protein
MGKGPRYLGANLVSSGSGGQVVSGDPDMAAHLVNAFLCHRRRTAVLPGGSVLAEAAVDVYEASVKTKFACMQKISPRPPLSPATAPMSS